MVKAASAAQDPAPRMGRRPEEENEARAWPCLCAAKALRRHLSHQTMPQSV